MSIEALLEAAKYVELTGDPPGRPTVPAASSRGNIGDSSEEREVKESTSVNQSPIVTAGHSTIPQEKPHNLGQEPVVQHVVRTAIDAGQKKLPSVSGKELILSTESSQVPTVDKNIFSMQTGSIPQGTELPSEIPKDITQLQCPNVMRHPGYDVRWSYSPPPPPQLAAPPHDQVASSSAGYSYPPQRGSVMTSPDNASPKVDDTSDTEEGKHLKTGVREVHNKLEKNRRAHLKECFDSLKSQIPTLQDRKAKISNSNILSGACRYIGALKRKEKELEHELDRLVRDKIQKQKLLHRLKIETSKNLHLGLSWHREGSVIGHDTSADVTRPASVTEKGQDRDEEDRYSTSTASETEEEERKSQQSAQSIVTATSSVVTAVATMTTTVTNSSASSCQTITSTSSTTSLPSGSYRHPLKLHLLREHRAQVAREKEAAAATSIADYPQEPTTTPVATASGPGTSVTVVPNMPISPSARPTVSQLLGKPSVSIRQPVRKQTPCHSVVHPIQRYQAPGQSFIRAHHREIAVRPSSTQPVVTIGVTQAMQSRPDLSPQNIKHSPGQVVPVTPQGLKLPHNHVMDNATNLGHSVSIVSSSLPASFLQAAIPGVSAALTQPLMAPITLSPTPVKQVFLTHQNFTGYASVPSLSPSLLRPFLTAPQTIVNPVLTNITQSTSNTPISVFSGSLPRSHPTMALKGSGLPVDSSIRQPLITTGTVTSTFSLNPTPVLPPRQITTVSSVAVSSSSTQPQPMIAAMTSAVKAAVNKNGKVAGSHRDKPLITTSQIAQTLLANGGMSKVKTVTAGTPAVVTSTNSLGKSLLA